MTATITALAQITYRDGYIEIVDAVNDQEAEIEALGEDYEIIETGCCGWGEHNTVIRSSQGSYYLSTILTEDRPTLTPRPAALTAGETEDTDHAP